MDCYDVIVVGLGGMGSSAAYHLARRGAHVLGLEQFTPGHSLGSSHGHSRVIRQAYFEDPAYVPLLLRAYELWSNLERESGTSLVQITGGLMIGMESSAVFQGSLRSAQQHQLHHEVLDAEQINRRFPELHPSREVGLYESLAGVVRPEAAIRAHLHLAQKWGCEIHGEEPVLDWRADETSVRVTTGKQVYQAKRLIITSGAWASRMIQQPLPLRVTEQTLYWFEPLSSLDLFRPPHFPIYIWQTSPHEEFYGFPAMDFPDDPGGVKVAFFYRNREIDPDRPRSDVEPSEIAQMREVLRDRIPNLSGKLLCAKRCLYTETPDHHFLIDRHSEAKNVIIASPCSGHGYKFCSVIGEILADLAINGATRHPIDLFRMDRFLQRDS